LAVEQEFPDRSFATGACEVKRPSRGKLRSFCLWFGLVAVDRTEASGFTFDIVDLQRTLL